MSLVMFVSMMFALPLFYYKLYSPRVNSHSVRPVPRRILLILIAPSLCDLFGSSFQQMGLVYVPVSVYQMLKGSIVIFSAVLSRIFLKRYFSARQICGLITCFLALVLVGVSSVMNRGGGSSSLKTSGLGLLSWFFGIFCIIFGQVLCATQYIFEEYMLKAPNNLDTLALVGLEGSIYFHSFRV